jgi:hypothetical protein
MTYVALATGRRTAKLTLACRCPHPAWQLFGDTGPYECMGESSADRIEKFRSNATELREKAAQIPASALRDQFLDIACEYDALAAVIERRLSGT